MTTYNPFAQFPTVRNRISLSNIFYTVKLINIKKNYLIWKFARKEALEIEVDFRKLKLNKLNREEKEMSVMMWRQLNRMKKLLSLLLHIFNLFREILV